METTAVTRSVAKSAVGMETCFSGYTTSMSAMGMSLKNLRHSGPAA
jgi:hypothetical protein